MKRTLLTTISPSTLLLFISSAHAEGTVIDQIVFGNSQSEAAHDVLPGSARRTVGGLGQSARVLTAAKPGDWKSDSLSFHLKVTGDVQNYATVRLWGSDVNHNKLALYCDGHQIGYRHLGDIEILDLGTEAPTYAGRFTYKTFPLPLSLTQGKATLSCYIRALGPFASYNLNFEAFQKPMDGDARPLYALYVHTNPYFESGAVEGKAPTNPPARPEPNEEVMEAIKDRVNRDATKLISATRPLTLDEMYFLSRAYHMEWTSAYKNAAVAKRIAESGDDLYRRFETDHEVIFFSDSAKKNDTWQSAGLFGYSIHALKDDVGLSLGATIAGVKGPPVSRRQAFAEMLAAGQEYLLTHRRMYTNQSMIVDLTGIYYSNLGLKALDSSLARPEEEMRGYLYESIGLRPWSGSRDDQGRPSYSSSPKSASALRVSNDHKIFTTAGLSRELGYVGSYGEIQDLVARMYEATAERQGGKGDPLILAQLIRISQARLAFRYPIIDQDGYRSMALEAVVGWRDPKYPGAVTYVQKIGWDNTPFYIAKVAQDPKIMAAAQQMLSDNQYYAALKAHMQNTGQRVTFGILDAYDEWLAVKAWPKQDTRLPMSVGQPDFVFADPENGVVAVKRGEERLYASLFWRANCGVNRLTRIHFMTPEVERVATVYGRVDFVPSGNVCTRAQTPHYSAGAIPNIVYPDDTPAALAGETLPIAKAPPEARFEGARDNPYAGRGDYYETRYGPFLIAMNAGESKPVALSIPQSAMPVTDLVTKTRLAPQTRQMSVKPGQTVVLYFEAQ